MKNQAVKCKKCDTLIVHDKRNIVGCGCDPDAPTWVYIEPDGRVRVGDRRKDVIITGGVNVSPTAVEHVLLLHPAIRDVCVVGLPDPEWGDRVVAYVVPVRKGLPPSLADLRAFAQARLTAAELPREIRTVDEIPRSPGGKLLRRLLPR